MLEQPVGWQLLLIINIKICTNIQKINSFALHRNTAYFSSNFRKSHSLIAASSFKCFTKTYFKKRPWQGKFCQSDYF